MNNINDPQKQARREAARARFFSPQQADTIRIVAEGDSWYDYPMIKDIVDHLCDMDYSIIKESKAGDTLENIVFGNDYDLNECQETATFLGKPNIEDTLRAIRRYKPHFVMFSAGGNDIMGEELGQYLNHASAKPSHFLRKRVFNDTLRGPIRTALVSFIERTLEAHPETHILMDGYAYPFPSGKKFRLLGLGLSGPWILPNFARKGITRPEDQLQVLRLMVDGFNELLQELAREYQQFHYIDLRPYFTRREDWRDEMHLTPKAYKQAARLYHHTIQWVLANPMRMAG